MTQTDATLPDCPVCGANMDTRQKIWRCTLCCYVNNESGHRSLCARLKAGDEAIIRLDAAEKENAALRARIGTLQLALFQFGVHRMGCYSQLLGNEGGQDMSRCSCGLGAALAGKETDGQN